MIKSVNIKRINGQVNTLEDLVVIEEPLEIRLVHGKGQGRRSFSLTVTMRTPGHDFELAMGFLLSEGLISSFEEIEDIRYCESVKEEESGNVLKVHLREDIEIDETALHRHFYTSSSCGVCGKSSIDAVQGQSAGRQVISGSFTTHQLSTLAEQMRSEQPVFRHTGGLHAAGLADPAGNLIFIREDIGRHNAVDKVIGAALKNDLLPLDRHLLLVSGRAGFELIQKAVMAGIGTFAAVGAPSSLAVELARESGLTLIGFLRNDRFNIYNGEQYIK